MYKIMKIYYDKVTGERIWANSYNYATEVNFEHDYQIVRELKERDREAIGLLVLENGQYEQDFAESIDYTVNPKEKTLNFIYPDPNAPDEPQSPVIPLTVQIEEVRLEQARSNTELFETMLMMSGGM